METELAALKRAGHEVQLFSLNNDDLSHSAWENIRSAARVATHVGRGPWRELSRFAPDVVHVHNLFPNYGRNWIKRLRVPIVHTVHNFRPLCAAGTLYRDGRSCHDCLEGSSWNAVRHACYEDSRIASAPLALATMSPLSDPLLSSADALVMLSPRQLQIYRRIGIPPNRLHLIPPFLPAHLDPGLRPSVPTRDWIFVGRLDPDKGVRELVVKWPEDEELVLVGDGPLRSVLEALERPHVEFVGQVDRKQAIRYIRGSKGLIVPSKTYETFGLSYLEALACGVPVVTLGDNSVADRVREESTGVVGSWDEDLSAILARVRQDPSRRRFQRAVFERRYSEKVGVARLEKLYRGLLSRRTSNR